MRSYVRAKDVHRHMKRLLSDWFLERDWRKRTGYSCAFVREDMVFWVQPSQWGDSWSGSSLALNLAKSESSELIAGDRILQHLDTTSRKDGLALEERIVSRIPLPENDHYIYRFMELPGHEGQMFRDSFEQAFKATPICWEPGYDIWLRYFSTDDLDEWTEFLLPRLDSLIEQWRPLGSA